jgi:hypothetical protein
MAGATANNTHTKTSVFTQKIRPRVANLVLRPAPGRLSINRVVRNCQRENTVDQFLAKIDLGAKWHESLQEQFVSGRRADNVNDIFKDVVFWCCPTQS